MKNSLLFVQFLVIIPSIYTQSNIEWQKSYGGSEFDEAGAIVETSEGGYMVAGIALSHDGDVFGNHGSYDYWVLKLSNTGNIEWQRSLGGDDTDWFYDAHLTSDGGYVLAGFTQSNNGDVSGNHGDKDAWVVKLSSTGEIQWQKSLGGSKWDAAWSVQQTFDGGYIVAGASNSSDGDATNIHAYADFWVIKLNEGGSIEWQKTLGGNSEDMAYCIRQTLEGGYIVVGETSSIDGDVTNNHGSSDCWVVKLDVNGNIEWKKSLGSNGIDRANSVYPTSEGGYIVVGIISYDDGDVTGFHGIYDIWAVKLNNIGEIEWQRALGGSGLDYGYFVQQTNDGDYIIAGSTQSMDGDVQDNDGGADAWVLKLTPEGEIRWQKTLGGTKAERSNSIHQTSDGGFILAGYNWSSDGDASGCKGKDDFWVVKLSSGTISIEETPMQIGKLEVFPNPSPNKIFIKTDAQAPFRISISDLLGREISRQNISTGEGIDISKLANGLYVVSAITMEGQVFNSKFRKQE